MFMRAGAAEIPVEKNMQAQVFVCDDQMGSDI